MVQGLLAHLTQRGCCVEVVGIRHTASADPLRGAVLAAGVESRTLSTLALPQEGLVVETLGAVGLHRALLAVEEDGVTRRALAISGVVVVRLALVTPRHTLAQGTPSNQS